MPGILPDSVNGGLVRRDIAGVCQTPVGVANAYCPPATFTSTCEITALPSDCTARIAAAQINAMASEMLCLASTINPNGSWNCTSLCNLASNFTAWATANRVVDGVSIGGSGTTADPWRVLPQGVASSLCGDDTAADTLAQCMISGSPGNGLAVGPDGRIYGAGTNTDTTIDGTGAPGSPFGVNITSLVNQLCADPAGDQLAACLISTQPGNGLATGSDGRLFALSGDPIVDVQDDPVPNVALRFVHASGAIEDVIRDTQPLFVQTFQFTDNPNHPTGGTYAQFLASLPPHIVNIVNPYADRTAAVSALGSSQQSRGWSGAPLVATTQAYVNGALLSDAAIQGTTPVVGGGGELRQEGIIQGGLAPGGNVNIQFNAGGAIAQDAGATDPTGTATVTHMYTIRFTPWVN